MTAADDVDALRRHITFKATGERSLRADFATHMLAALDAGATPDYQVLLRAAQWPAPPEFTFHTAPQGARDMIALTGLRAFQPGSPETDSPWADPNRVWADQPAGVYVTEVADDGGRWSRWAFWDVWQVRTTDLPWSPDPLNPRCWVISSDITPDRVRLHSSHHI